MNTSLRKNGYGMAYYGSFISIYDIYLALYMEILSFNFYDIAPILNLEQETRTKKYLLIYLF